MSRPRPLVYISGVVVGARGTISSATTRIAIVAVVSVAASRALVDTIVGRSRKECNNVCVVYDKRAFLVAIGVTLVRC